MKTRKKKAKKKPRVSVSGVMERQQFLKGHFKQVLHTVAHDEGIRFACLALESAMLEFLIEDYHLEPDVALHLTSKCVNISMLKYQHSYKKKEGAK